MDKNLLRDVLIAPVVSEKSYSLLDENKYTFVVKKDANKTQIRQAVEELFNVKVLSVNTLNRKGKTYRTRFGEGSRSDSTRFGEGSRSDTKRAIVSLAQGDRIDIFNAPSA